MDAPWNDARKARRTKRRASLRLQARRQYNGGVPIQYVNGSAEFAGAACEEVRERIAQAAAAAAAGVRLGHTPGGQQGPAGRNAAPRRPRLGCATSVRVTCRRRWRRSRHCADRAADLALHRPRCRPTRRAPSPSSFAWVHGVDRLKIAERLAEQRPFHAPPLNVCLQVNIAGESSKGGVDARGAAGAGRAVARAAAAEAARPDVPAAGGGRSGAPARTGSRSCAQLQESSTRTAPASTPCRWA